jgi:hypothetical protein
MSYYEFRDLSTNDTTIRKVNIKPYQRGNVHHVALYLMHPLYIESWSTTHSYLELLPTHAIRIYVALAVRIENI